MSELETDSGLKQKEEETHPSTDEAVLYQRLYKLGEHLLSLMEEFYTRFYHQTLPISANAVAADSVTAENALESNRDFTTRLQALLDTALKVAEAVF